MPGSPAAPGRAGARDGASVRIAFRLYKSVSTREGIFAAQWLAYALPCRRFADALAGNRARLGADAVRYTFIVVDLHHLPLAGLPAHCKYPVNGAYGAAMLNADMVNGESGCRKLAVLCQKLL